MAQGRADVLSATAHPLGRGYWGPAWCHQRGCPRAVSSALTSSQCILRLPPAAVGCLLLTLSLSGPPFPTSQIKEVMNNLPPKHQTLLFSATMPKVGGARGMLPLA